jgi:hypothetical protein
MGNGSLIDMGQKVFLRVKRFLTIYERHDSSSDRLVKSSSFTLGRRLDSKNG